MLKLSNLFSKTLAVFLSLTLVLSSVPCFSQNKQAEAVENKESAENLSVVTSGYESEQTDSGRVESADVVAKTSLQGGTYRIIDKSDVNSNVKDLSFYDEQYSRNRASESLPEKIDLRDYNGQNRVTSIKNQSATGTCWAFGANAASETSVAKSLNSSATTSFSPFQTAYFAVNSLSSDTTQLQGTEVSQAGEGVYWPNSLLKAYYALNLGGSTKQASSSFFSGVGPTKESDIKFPDESLSYGLLLSSLTQQQRRYALARLTKWSWLGSLINTTYDSSTETTSYVSTNETVLKRIKTELSNGNAVEIAYCGDNSDNSHEKYIDQDTKSQYTYEYATSNHSVCVVGYDDTYSKSNFIEGHQPEKDGAFIVKNSWGSSWGKDGYFYLSYYDKSVSDASTYTFDTSLYDGENLDAEKQIIDQYDYTSSLEIYNTGIQSEKAQWYSNVYTASQAQKLHSIGTYYCSGGQALSYKVYKLKKDATSPSDVAGSLSSPDAQGTYTSEYEGFTSIKLDTPVVLQEGEKYAIWFSQKNDNNVYCAPQAMSLTEAKASDSSGNILTLYGTNVIVNSGESFYMPESSDSWSTLSKIDDSGYSFDNYCVKGYATALNVRATFDSNGGTTVDTQTIPDGSKVSKPDNPTKTGFKFDGWYTDKDFKTAFDFDKELTRNVTLYAKWTATIEYELNGGTLDGTNPTSYVYTVGVSSFVNPTKTGYTFQGWWTKDGTDGDWGEQLTSIAADDARGNVKLYAKWQIVNYTITYNDTKDATNENPTSFTYETESITLKNIEKAGYTFEGWWTKDGSADDDWGSQVETINKGTSQDVTLWAKWDIIFYKINYGNMEGATNPNPDEYTVEDDTIYLKSPTKTGYWSRGWYYKNGGDSYDNDDWGDSCSFIEKGSTGDVTIYARWMTETYTVKFSGVDGATNPNGDTLYYDINSKTEALQDASKDGYIFNGWFDANGNQVKQYGGGATGDLELTAHWTEIKKYDVKFVDWDGTEISSGKVVEGKSAPAPANPDREGYTFTGWDKDFSNVTGDMTITAQYSINKYTVKFVDWDSTVINTQEVEWGSPATAPETKPSREGYIFTGWSPSDFSRITDNITIQAQYAEAHRVRFYDSDGNIIKEEWVQEGHDATPPTADKIPVKDGYVFVRWYGDYTNVMGDITVVAVCEKNVFTVTFYDDDYAVLKTETVKKGGSATAPEPREKAGYTFAGWDRGFSNITADTYVKATYEINKYTVSFNSNGGSAVKPQTVEYGRYAEKPSIPTRTGYTFAGWYSDEQLTEEFDFDNTKITDNLSLNAKWDVDYYDVNFVDWDGTPLQSTRVAYGNSATAPVKPTRVGYTFTSWDKDYSKVSGNMTIKAQYKINTYTVTFKSNGGSAIKSQTVNFGKSATKPANPMRSGYTFAGWYADSSLTLAYNFSSGVVTNVTLYAKWTKNADVTPTPTPTPVVESSVMHRLYNKYTGEHFYTSDTSEYKKLVNLGWNDEGEGWKAPAKSNKPVYRLYNKYVPGGDHHYTMNATERDSLVKAGWQYEGIGWYSDESQGVALYRQYNPYAQVGTHNYTTSKSENDKLVKAGWKSEGIAWYGAK